MLAPSLPRWIERRLTVYHAWQSYLAPEKGTALLRWLAGAFEAGSIALYDPIGLQASESEAGEDDGGAFGSTLQRYFAVKGCTLRGARGYRTAADHARRLLARAHWQRCHILDMNGVFAACTSAEEKRRLTSLEPFDEFSDWTLCNAHYALYVADNGSDRGLKWPTRLVPRGQQRRYLLTANLAPPRVQAPSQAVIVRSFQAHDLAAVRSVFESSHLEFAQGSRAVRQFVANRLRGPSGDMFDVRQAFQSTDSSGFWVAEVGGDVVGCVGVKPLAASSSQQPDANEGRRTAELCRLSVAPAVRRRGVASALVSAVETFAAASGAFDEIQLETIGAMEGAQQLYRALGYTDQPEDEKLHSSFKLVRFQKALGVSAT
jgi:ribosomal protein S18 acetylase RimI-like enzyme